MVGKRNLFRCIVVPNPVDKHSYRDFPRTYAQKYEMTRDEAKKWCKNALGKPIQAGHIDTVSVGRVKNSFTDDDGKWFVDIELEDNLVGLKAESDIRKGVVNCVSLAHYQNSGEVKEISLVNIPARDGSVILDDIVQASKALSKNTTTNVLDYNNCFTIQELNYTQSSPDNLHDTTLIMASNNANPLQSGFIQSNNPSEANNNFNSQPNSVSVEDLERRKMELENFINSLKFQQQQQRGGNMNIPQNHQQQQQQQQQSQQRQPTPHTISNGNIFPASSLSMQNPYEIFPSNAGPLGTVVSGFTDVLQSHAQAQHSKAMASQQQANQYQMYQMQQQQQQQMRPGNGQHAFVPVQASASWMNSAPVPQQQQPQATNTNTQAVSQLSTTPKDASSNEVPADTTNSNTPSTSAVTTNTNSVPTSDPVSSTSTGSKSYKKGFFLPSHPALNAPDDEVSAWEREVNAKVDDILIHSNATHEEKAELLKNARRHIDSCREKHGLAKKNAENEAKLAEFRQQEKSLQTYNLNMRIDKLSGSHTIDQQALNKIRQEYEAGVIQYDIATKGIDQLELNASSAATTTTSSSSSAANQMSQYNRINNMNGFGMNQQAPAQYNTQGFAMQQYAHPIQASASTFMQTPQGYIQQPTQVPVMFNVQSAGFESHLNAMAELNKRNNLQSSSSSSGYGAVPVLASGAYGNNFHHKAFVPATSLNMCTVYNPRDPVDNANKILEFYDNSLVAASANQHGISTDYNRPYNNQNGAPTPFRKQLGWEATGAMLEAAAELNRADGNYVFMSRKEAMNAGFKDNKQQ